MNAPFQSFLAACAALAAFALAGCGGAADGPAGAADARDDGPLVLAFMPDIPPYACQDRETGELRGIDLDIVRAAAARLGRELVVRQVPFAGLLTAVKSGAADYAASGITITEGRKHDADFSDPYAEEGCAFLYRAGDPPPTMITAEGLRVGVVESMSSDFYLTRHGIETFRYSGLPELVEDLAAGRLDAVFYDRPALVIEAEAAGGAFAVTPLETREPYGIAVRKGRPDLLEAVNAVIRERNGREAPR
ncbi:MAG: amino acid ABC transporter substrate-binding protein [Kiritimatiellae bacterium]|nr:amino acid ABC transporter substrate-binding protein [Kiritimatiellia bacterium]